jgi:hypothetical protein
MIVFSALKSKVALKKSFGGPESVPGMTGVGCDDMVEEVNISLELSVAKLAGEGCRGR